MNKKIKLNLGCGNKKFKDFINIDNNKYCNPDKIMDLNKKLEFKDNSISEIVCNDVIEHLKDHEFFLKECFRILKINGVLKIHVPHYKYTGSYRIGHKNHYSFSFWKRLPEEYFNELSNFKVKTWLDYKFFKIRKPKFLVWFIELLLPTIGLYVELTKINKRGFK